MLPRIARRLNCGIPVILWSRFTGAAAVLLLTLRLASVTAYAANYALSVSTNSNRSAAIGLQGASLSGNVYIFTSSASNATNFNLSGISTVCFWRDNVAMSGTATHCEARVPYDFAGSNDTLGVAKAWSTTAVANGTHSITQKVTLSTGATEVDTATFTINNPLPGLQSLGLSPATVAGGQNSTGTVTLTGAAPAGGAVVFVSSNITAAAQVPASGTVTVPAGATSATFQITTSPVSASTAVVISANYNGGTKTAGLTVNPATTATYSLSVSKQANHSGAVALNGVAIAGTVYVFTSLATQPANFNPSGISTVCFWLDNTAASGTAKHCEGKVPFDYAGSNDALGVANPWSVTTLANGTHTITQVVTKSAGGTEKVTATFSIRNITAAFSSNPKEISAGQTSKLTWSTTGATSVSIDQGIGAVALSGTLDQTPSATTTYTLTVTGPAGSTSRRTTAWVDTPAVHHYEYAVSDGNLFVYDLDNNFQLVKQVSLPQVVSVRGIGAAINSRMLYVVYGHTGGSTGTGSLMAYNLLTDTVVWTKAYPFGVDSFALTPDGKTIYLPDGVTSGDGIWYVVEAATGNVTGSIDTGKLGPHNTIVSLDGTAVFMGPRNSPYLVEGSTSSNTVVGSSGPLLNGVGPFTINGKHTLAFIAPKNNLAFQVSDTASGVVLFTLNVPGFSNIAGFTANHGISLSPDEKEIYLIDARNQDVHVFDVSGLPVTQPALVASIPLATGITGNESPCSSQCTREGWLHHSRDGRYVFVGDSGDVIDTTLRQIVGTVPALRNERHGILEIDWQNGVPVSTTTHYGLGYVTQ
jgi:hypothetical protein